ncbi:MAG: argininosuccinate lyase [Acidimicrobiales bacterium]|nr:MAG: argininosuccinate lyase [Acidimicrobiales bacterium]
MGTLWQGRFRSEPAPEMMALSRSVHFDTRLWREDIEGSRAHVEGLERAGVISATERDALLGALDVVAAELADGTFELRDSDEDVHTAVERRVTELVGDVGRKLHTGRSRNDQVATDVRLFCRSGLASTAEELARLVEALLRRVEHVGDAVMPGYTHLKRAQVVPVGHHLLAHVWALLRDLDRMVAALDRNDVCPLGAGALAGSSLPLDPGFVAERLGFGRPFENSIDAVSDRDHVAETLFVVALCGIHLSRLAEELVLWCSDEFGFVELDDSYATGSSMLPHKKNPDVAELTRAKSGRLVGHLVALLVALKGLPLAYDRDLQEDKEPLIDAFDQMRVVLPALRGLVASMRFDLARMREAAGDDTLAAVDLAELLVSKGVPFRTAHSRVASLVRDAREKGTSLREAVGSDEQWASHADEALEVIEQVLAGRRRRSAGGADMESVRGQLERARERLAESRRRLEAYQT